MNKIILCPTIESAKESVNKLGSFNSIEAEYGDVCIKAIDGITLAHHGSRSNNPAPCVAEVESNDLPIIVSHIDLDTIGGIMRLHGLRNLDDSIESEFWKVAAYVDVHGVHRLHEANPSEKVVHRLNAWYAYNEQHRAPRITEATDITDLVETSIEAIQAILLGDTEMIADGEKWHQEVTSAIESKLVEENKNIRVFITDGVFCSASYFSPTLQTVAKATITLNTKFNAITIAFEDGGKEHSAAEIVQKLWGKDAGGRAGIAGSPRGEKMTNVDLQKACETVRKIYVKKTIEISATIGVVSGYGHDNQGGAPELFLQTLQRICKEVFEGTGTYCSFVAMPSKTIYHIDWGCPVGGEETFSISTICNPEFSDVQKFKAAAFEVLRRLKKELKQSTLSVVEKEVEMSYWK